MRYFVGSGETLKLDRESRRELRGSFVELSDGVCHYELSGPEGSDVVVLTGGLTVPLFYWDGLASALHERGLRTLAFSAYGRGYSDRLTNDYNEELFVRQVADLLRALGIVRHHLVGTSMGAVVSMQYLRQKTAAETLTLVGPAGLAKRPRTEWIVENDRIAAAVGKRLGRRLLDGHLSHNVRDAETARVLAGMVGEAFQYEGSMYALFSTLQNFPLFGRADLFRQTGNLAIPKMLLWGDDDQVTPITNLETAVSLLRPAQVHVIEQCGHMAPLERPVAVADLIASFVSTTAHRHSS